MEGVKLCKDCKYSKYRFFKGSYFCINPKLYKPSIVSGKIIGDYCATTRKLVCDPTKRWESKR